RAFSSTTASIPALWSLAVTLPCGPTTAARTKAGWPDPLAKSRIAPPGAAPTASTTARVTPANTCAFVRLHFLQAATVCASLHSRLTRSRNCAVRESFGALIGADGIKLDALQPAGERAEIFVGQSARLHLGVGHEMRRFALGQQRGIVVAQHGVTEPQYRTADVAQFGADAQQVVIPCGRLVAAARLRHYDVAAFFALQGLVVEPTLAQEFSPAHLEPCEIVAVVDDAHLVGLRVAHAQGGLGKMWHRAGKCRRRSREIQHGEHPEMQSLRGSKGKKA